MPSQRYWSVQRARSYGLAPSGMGIIPLIVAGISAAAGILGQSKAEKAAKEAAKQAEAEAKEALRIKNQAKADKRHASEANTKKWMLIGGAALLVVGVTTFAIMRRRKRSRR